MTIRPATIDDADALARVHIDSWRASYRGIVPDSHLDGLDYGRRADAVRAWLPDHPDEDYVWEQDGVVAGYLSIGPCADPDLDPTTAGEIRRIYLVPSHIGRGIGFTLCAHGEQLLRERGFRLAVLWVFTANEAARRFYEGMGFRADGATRILNPGGPVEAMRYRKELGKPFA